MASILAVLRGLTVGVVEASVVGAMTSVVALVVTIVSSAKAMVGVARRIATEVRRSKFLRITYDSQKREAMSRWSVAILLVKPNVGYYNIFMNLSKIMSLNSRSATFFGWLSITLSILAIPYLVISVIAAFANPGASGSNPTGSLIAILSTLAYISTLKYFQVVLNKKFSFHKADRLLGSYIIFDIVLTVLIEVLGYIDGARVLQSIAVFATMVVMGIIFIALGIKFLSISDDLYGFRKALAVNFITAGVMFASLVLFLIAIIPTLIAQVIIGIITLRVAVDLPKKSK